MSIFLSPSEERNFHFLVDKSSGDDSSYDSEGAYETPPPPAPKNQKVQIWVSREFLAVVSPVFKTMFFGDFVGKDKKCIYLPGKNDEDFLKFLECLFPYPTQHNVEDYNVEAVLRLSDEYQIECLIKKCDEFYEGIIKRRYGGDETVLVEYLPICLQYKLNKAIRACVPYAAMLNLDMLAHYRSEFLPETNEYYGFFCAVYEAKLRRVGHEKHAWCACYELGVNQYRCEKCRKPLPQTYSIVPEICSGFCHCSLNGSWGCLCGYDFDAKILNL